LTFEGPIYGVVIFRGGLGGQILTKPCSEFKEVSLVSSLHDIFKMTVRIAWELMLYYI
jgi:hypothetical protein